MQERGAHLDDPPEPSRLHRFEDAQGSRPERELARAADEQLGRARGDVRDRPARGCVDPERLLGEEMLAGAEDLDVELLVQVVRDGAVDGVDVGAREQLVHVCVERVARDDAVREPVEARGVDVADGDDLRTEVDVQQMDPPRRGARDLTAHQPRADDAEPDGRHHWSWTIAISLRVTPAGSGSCTMLRP